LAAAGRDVDAATLPHCAGQREFLRQDLLETGRGLAAARGARVAGRGVERDQIHLGRQSAQQLPDCASVGFPIVPPLDQRPFVKNAAAGRGAVRPAGCHEFVQGPFPGDGDERGPARLGGGVEGDGQMHRPAFLGEAQNPGDNPDRAERNALGTERDAGGIEQDIDRLHHRLVIVEGLAHAHQDDVAQARPVAGRRALALAQDAVDMDGLGDDFAGRQVPAEAHLSRGAEDAAHGAAGLAADAGRDPAGKTHQDRFDDRAVFEGQEVFAGEPVGRMGLTGDRQGAQGGFRLQPVPDFGRQLGHGGKGRSAFPIEIAPEQRGMGGETPGSQEFRKLGAGQRIKGNPVGHGSTQEGGSGRFGQMHPAKGSLPARSALAVRQPRRSS